MVEWCGGYGSGGGCVVMSVVVGKRYVRVYKVMIGYCVCML